MATYTQAKRPLSISTPLGKDALLLEKLSGVEAISQPYCFHLELLAEKAVVFDQLIGQAAAVELTPPHETSPRHFHGVVARLGQGGRLRLEDGKATFIRYRLDLVPRFWTLQKRSRSRIFHDLSVLEILHQLLKVEWQLDVTQAISSPDHFPKHNYRVQYEESDFHFASRLMEEAGLFYYFKHTATAHEMVIADESGHCPDLAGPAVVKYEEIEGGARTEPRIHSWEKLQELCPGKCTLADYHFELPGNDLGAQHTILDQVAVGTVAHSFKAGNEHLEVCEYPGRYTSHYDSVNFSGMVDVASRLDPVYQEKDLRAKIRMEQAAAEALQIEGGSDCGHFLPGFKFTLANHYDGNGKYVLTQVEHTANLEGTYRTGSVPADFYQNRFRCVPAALPYRPPCLTRRPRIVGTQTAVVVGTLDIDPPVDKYGRVKVQFRWEDKKKAQTSCWVRVGQTWAGNRWGAFFWPRIGHEVIVAFENGDPDRPIIVGSVYNADNMPPLELPLHANRGGIKSCSIGGDPLEQFCSFVFHDLPGNEHLHLHSEHHAVHTSEAMGFQRLPGRKVEIHGSLPLPEPGSGSGAGSPGTDSAQSPQGALEGWDWMSGSAKKLYEFKEENFPGSYMLTPGELTSIVLGSSRITHILGGSDIKLAFTKTALLDAATGGAVTKLKSSLFPSSGGGGVSSAGVAKAILFGVSGDVGLTLGPKVSTVYLGPKVDIERCPPPEKYTNVGFEGLVGKGVIALGALTVLAALGGAIWAYLNARLEHYNTVFSATNKGKVTDPPTWAKMLSTQICERLHGVLNELEKGYGRAQKAKKNAEAAVQSADQAAALLLTMSAWSSPVANLTKNYTEISADAAAKAAMGAGAKAIGDKAGMATAAAAQEKKQAAAQAIAEAVTFQDHALSYGVSAHNIYLVSHKTNEASGIDLLALGGPLAHNAHIDIRADGQVLMTAGGKASLGIKQSTDTAGQICLNNNLLGTIQIQQGALPTSPSIKLDGSTLATPSITLAIGTGPDAASLKVDGTPGTPSIKLAVGAGPTAASLVLATTGITMTFGEWDLQMNSTGIVMKTQAASIALTPTDLQVSAVNDNDSIKAQHKQTITMRSTTVSATSKNAAAIEQVD